MATNPKDQQQIERLRKAADAIAAEFAKGTTDGNG